MAVSTWIKKAVLVLVLLGFLDLTLRLAWASLRPAAPLLLLAALALFILIRMFKRHDGS